MFSTISNMLPNLSLQGPDKDSPTPNANSINPFDKLMAVKRRLEGARTSHSVEPEQEEEEVQEERREERRERRKQKPLNETFVVVRPPPSVSNHPLNLQLQLIPPTIQPSHATRSASTSTTASTSSAGGERGYAAAGGVPNVPPVSAGLQSKKEAQRQQTAEPQQDDELLSRRANRSDLSLFYSSMGSSASVTSFSTVASTTTSSGTRRIIPLYNLSAHNVLQNTVQDAGKSLCFFCSWRVRACAAAKPTFPRPSFQIQRRCFSASVTYKFYDPKCTDATVSRFRKRGIDIVGLGILEPIELHGQVPAGAIAVANVHIDVEGASDAGHGSNLGHSGVSESDHSPPSQSSHLKEGSGYLRDRPSQSHLRGRTSPSPPSQLREVTLPDEPTPKESAGKKFFGKLFKRKDPGTPTTPTSPGLLSPATPRGSSTVNRTSTLAPSVPSARPASTYSVVPPSPATPTPTTPTTTTSYLQPPVLGTQASLRCESYPPAGRPSAYVWVLRKWTKGGGMFSGIVGAGAVDMVRVGVEVRFEWVRGKKKRERGEYAKTEGQGGRPVSVVSLGEGDNLGLPEGGSFRSVSPDARSRRGSESHPRPRRDSKRSASPTKHRVHPSSGSDDGEDSDPEDSETPWSCTLRVLPLDASSQPLKLRLAHLVPAPHHPKVIGQFKMPFPLPDVHIQNLELIPRSASDPFGMDQGRGEGMVMTAEEIKDVVCTTGLWLMVREGFGGLSGKKRKGDGWKIRS